MVFRFRKSFRIIPGVRINLGAKNASVRVGPKGLGYTISTTGKKRLTARVPGTGLSYSQDFLPKRQPRRGAALQLIASETNTPETKPSPKGPLALLLVALAVGLGWYGTPTIENRINGEGSSSSGHVQPRPNSTTAEPASSIPTTLYSTANVRLRTSPSAKSTIVLTVPTGSALSSSKRDGTWHYVSYGKYSGWISGDYLAEQPGPATIVLRTAPEVSGEQPAADGKSISGRATIVDGDTIEIAGTRVRFNGIDAPESAQLCRNAAGKNYRCGQSAAKALDAWLAKSRPVTCRFVEWDRYDRFVGDCYRADGAAVAIWLVGAGHAMDWPEHSGGAYASYQGQAREAKRGIWQGEFQPAWEWRAAQRSTPKPEATRPIQLLADTCGIKGNINNKGVRIYHLPGQQFYDETVISPARGERMFCSEEEARAAGWRRSKR